jgi:hypothetical protein
MVVEQSRLVLMDPSGTDLSSRVHMDQTAVAAAVQALFVLGRAWVSYHAYLLQ